MTQSGSKSNLVYAWVVLFHENINTSEPFQIFPINQFEKKNFPWHAIKGFMHSEVRNEIHSLPSLPGKKYRLFAKIQHGKNCLIYRNGTFSFISVNQFVFLGVDSSRRKMEVDRLNEDYRAMTEMKISMGKIYHYMVESESYRILASAEYSWRESPLRLGRGQAEKEDFTSDDDEEEKKQQRVTAKKCSNLPKKNPSFGKKVRLNILSPFITKIKHRFSNFIQTLKKPMKASTPKKRFLGSSFNCLRMRVTNKLMMKMKRGGRLMKRPMKRIRRTTIHQSSLSPLPRLKVKVSLGQFQSQLAHQKHWKYEILRPPQWTRR